MRIHVGNISQELADDLESLEVRLAKHGSLKFKIDLKQKPATETYFAFVDIDLGQDGFGGLRKALNGVVFHQSILTIEEARPDYTEILAQRREAPAPGPNADQIKRLKSFNPATNALTGRNREAPRKDLKTLRLNTVRPGTHEPIPVKTQKQKLWGMEKRALNKLAHKFEDGTWKDGEGKPIEVVGVDEQTRNERMLDSISGVLSDSDYEEFKSRQTDDPAMEVDDEIEIVPKSTSLSRPAPYDESSEDELIEPEEHAPESDPLPKVTGTEALREALEVTTPFTLFGAADAVEAPVQPAVRLLPQKKKFGLFFTHDSPFLRSQTQGAKITGTFDPEAWQTKFEEHKSAWSREMRRQLMRKSSKKRSVRS